MREFDPAVWNRIAGDCLIVLPYIAGPMFWALGGK